MNKIKSRGWPNHRIMLAIKFQEKENQPPYIPPLEFGRKREVPLLVSKFL